MSQSNKPLNRTISESSDISTKVTRAMMLDRTIVIRCPAGTDFFAMAAIDRSDPIALVSFASDGLIVRSER